MKKSFHIALITCSSLLLIPTACSQSQTTNHNQSALAAKEVSTESIQQTASAIAVKISIGSSSGSGILIAQAGNTYTVVTNAHVIGRGNNYQITTVDGKTHQATLKKSEQSDNQDDLALLQFQATEKYTPASLGDAQQVTPGQSVFAVGFGDGEEQLTLNSGKIEQISHKPLVGGYQIGFTNTTKQGMSGGALLNEEGKVIGILGLGAGAILDNAYLYADRSRPDAQMLEQLRANSFAVPVTQIASSIASKQEKETQETDSKIAPSKKYTGLPGKIDNIAQQITVRIDSKNNGNGSGVIVAHDGDTYYVATAGHVVQNQDDYTVVAPDGQSYPVAKATIKTFEGVDLAVVQFQSQEAYTVATLGVYGLNFNNQKEVRTVFVSGFPGQKAETKQLPPRLLTAGIVEPQDVANSVAKDFYSRTNGYGLLYTNQSFPGMSGGAVLDSQGRVIGINTGAEDEVVVSKTTGDIAEISLGYSLGIPIGTFLGLAKSAEIDSGWLQQETSEPTQSTWLEKAAVKEQFFNVQEPSSNATEVDWLNYGNQLWRSFQDDKAIAAFERAIQLNPNSHYAYYGQGFTFYRQKKNKQANNAFKQATKLAPDFYPAWSWLGYMFLTLKQYSQALNAYNRAIQLSPENFVPYAEKGVALQNLKRYREAISSCTQSIEILPSSTVYNDRGNIYNDLEDYQAAIADFNRAIKLNPEFAPSYYNRGLTYSYLKDYQAAIANFDQAIELNPDYADAYNNRGIIYRNLKDYQQAIANFDQAIELNPNFALAYNSRGNAYSSLKNYEEAISDYNQAIELDPHLVKAYYNRGTVYSELKDYQGAIADFDQALKLNPNLVEAYHNRGSAYGNLKDYQRAIADINQAIKLNPNLAEAYGNRGSFYQKQQKFAPALSDYTKVLSLEKNDFAATTNIGLIKYELGAIKEAKKQFQQAINLDNKSAEPQLALAVTLYSLGESEKAITMAKKALSIDKQFADPEFLKENLWGDNLITDTEKLLSQLQI